MVNHLCGRCRKVRSPEYTRISSRARLPLSTIDDKIGCALCASLLTINHLVRAVKSARGVHFVGHERISLSLSLSLSIYLLSAIKSDVSPRIAFLKSPCKRGNKIKEVTRAGPLSRIILIMDGSELQIRKVQAWAVCIADV